MKILFLGTGDAFGAKANTSILVDGKVLLDCGLTTVQQLMKAGVDLLEIRTVIISHFHMDHIFGLPALLAASKKAGRKEPIGIYGPVDSEKYVCDLLSVAHKDTDSFGFELGISDAEDMEKDGYRFSYAPMEHVLPCKAVRVEKKGKSLFYTGDGRPTPEALDLMKGADLLIAESYMEGFSYHSSITESAGYAKDTGVKKLALVHVSGKENMREKISEAKKIFPETILATDLMSLEI
ncbi:MAG: MBL fold metallo-hydrolase [Candidatus Altiarchaeota archaeon]|nr:MBL fold metallo-hydrolase [Candidatus Altiarchaeota archaeon]